METRKLRDILSRMIDKVMISSDKVNDFTPGSAIRSLLEAVSLELEQFYILTKENIQWGISEGIVEAFDFARRKKKRAYGDITIEFYNPLEITYYIPKGTTFTSTRQQYTQQFETLVDYYVKPGSTTAVLEVYSKEAGTVGNVPENTINSMASASTLVKAVYNESSFSTGEEDETQEELEKRFHLFLDAIGRATNKSIMHGALKIENISGVYVDEEVGLITVYAHDNNGNLSPELQKEVEKSIEDYRPSGVLLKVKPVSKTELDISVKVNISNKNRIDEGLKLHIENVIRKYLTNFKVSDNLVLADLIQVIMNIDDELIHDVEFDNLTGNVNTLPEEIIRPGVINVTLV